MSGLRAAIVPVTPLQQNCALLWDDDTKRAWVVDPGGDVPRIRGAIEELGLQVERILLTHGHIDHAGGAAELRDALPGVPLEGPDERDAFLLADLAQQGLRFGLTCARNVRPDRFLAEGETLELGAHRFEIRHCPGHTPGHLVFLGSGIAIVGDVLFQGSVGRTDFPYGDTEALLDSIRDKLMPLPDETPFLCGHGPGSTIGQERRTNPFVREALSRPPPSGESERVRAPVARVFAFTLWLFLAYAIPRPAHAWGDEGHRAIALLADSLLQPDVRRRVNAILAADTDPLVAHDIASAATWADHLRQADLDGARMRTRRWHFADIELSAPSLDVACFKHKPLPPGTLPSLGPPNSCVVDKITQFTAELADPGAEAEEQLLALKFLLHLVGDVHQPLHAADDDDRGGNDKRVTAPGFRAGTLHHYWDSEFIRLLGSDPRQIATALRARISPAQLRDWSRGTAADWALESFALARDDAYGQLPAPGRRFSYELTGRYVDMAIRDTQLQLARAGVRLAFVLNRAFGRR